MKKFTTVTIWLIIGFIVIQYFLRVSYFKYILSDNFDVQGNINNIIDVFSVIIGFILDIIIVVFGAMALGHSQKEEREKAYSIFRYLYVILSIFSLLTDAYQLYVTGRYLFEYGVYNGVLRIFLFVTQTTLVIFLIKCKPENQIQKVNLNEYDLVTFTSGGHRFVHYLLDFLFVIPIWLYIIQMFSFLNRIGLQAKMWWWELTIELSLIIGLLLYYFLSEAIFRQTFGKIITRSCVVSDGVELSTGRVLIRTLCRLIPFDKFSFLFGAKWHDRVSSTAVVYIDSWEKTFTEEATEATA